tara:strand:+ start:859 stop:993 length:135 start_codon:yes stop_codon:yes gene_type:complete
MVYINNSSAVFSAKLGRECWRNELNNVIKNSTKTTLKNREKVVG